MAWTRIDDQFLRNPKIQRAGVHGMALYLAGLIYCNTNKTDGFIDEYLLPGLCGDAFQTPTRKSAEKLVELKLWHKVDGGYIVNDFLDYNRSKDEIEEINRKRAEAGAKGGRTKAANAKQSAINSEVNAKQNDSKDIANAKQIAKQKSTPNTLIPLYPKSHAQKEEESVSSSSSLKGENLEKTDDKTTAATATVFRAYEQEIGIVTPTIADDIKSLMDDGVPDAWFVRAFEESALHNKRNWAYAKAILNRWIADGKVTDNRKNGSRSDRKRASPQSGGDIDAFRTLVRAQQQANETKREESERRRGNVNQR